MRVYGTCTACEFESSGNTLEELDEKFKRHFVMAGHKSYFHKAGTVQKIRRLA